MLLVRIVLVVRFVSFGNRVCVRSIILRNRIRIRVIEHVRIRTIDSIIHPIGNRIRSRYRMCDNIVNSVRIVSMRIRIRIRMRVRMRIRVRIRT